MFCYPKTYILRHRKENLKKCSLRNLETRADFSFFTYPSSILPNLENYILLAVEAPPLEPCDFDKGLFLLDATWRYADKMLQFVEKNVSIEKRSIPKGFRTAYPRCQYDCPNPEEGLASVEALYSAYFVLGRDPSGLLDHYYWKDSFLEKNKLLFDHSPLLDFAQFLNSSSERSFIQLNKFHRKG